MKYLNLIAIAFVVLMAQGCASEFSSEAPLDSDTPPADTNELNNGRPEVAHPIEEAPGESDPGEGGLGDGEIAHPIERGPDGPEDAPEDDDLGDLDIAHPIERGPGGPEDAPGDSDESEGFGVDGGAEGDTSESEPGAIEGEDDGEDTDEAVSDPFCLEAIGECGEGAVCVATCEPSYCDEDGRCTQDCRMEFACVEIE